MCEQAIETTIHAFRECPLAREVLVIGECPNCVTGNTTTSTKEWLHHAVENLSTEKFDGLIVLLWKIWNRRNDKVHNDTLTRSRATIEAASLLQREFCMAHATESRPRIARQTPIWRKPIAGMVKINVDGAYSPTSRHATVRIVARDDDGMVLAGLAKRLEGIQNAGLAEAAAFHEGIQLEIDMGWTNANVEGDAMDIVNRLGNPDEDISTIRVHLERDRRILKVYKDITINYVNMVANSI
ncbi:hypothetical protein V6N12_036644 [Hibiscus sabdariffa]|uniref:RNase H type-1 domain-containing protein n=1 Tax=Hibiscus sabdariffa TaxID=183260 RepID=A0ABR2ER86_9ROSI